MGQEVKKANLLRIAFAILTAGAGLFFSTSPSRAEPLKTYSGRLELPTPCHLFPGGASTLCIQQTMDFTAKVRFKVGKASRVVRTGAHGRYSVRLPEGRLIAIPVALSVSLNSHTFTFAGRKIRLTGVSPVTTGKSPDRTFYVVRHRDFSAAGAECAGIDQGISGVFVNGNRFPVVCGDKLGCAKSVDKGVPSVAIVALNEKTGEEFKTTTSQDGHYSFTNLPAGSYALTALYSPDGGEVASDSSLRENGLPVLCDAVTQGSVGYFTY